MVIISQWNFWRPPWLLHGLQKHRWLRWGEDDEDVYDDDATDDDDDDDDVYNDDETYKVTWGGGDCKLHSRWMSVFERSTAQGYESIQVSVFQ